ncbi:MAG TPA: CheR family methyltransferase [Thermoanaerobaculia bacterium]|jgi:two-component system CheB/CheR fusion protein|nr:CheR family methyltransferase [Thermoanaerobaculia bacterium]
MPGKLRNQDPPEESLGFPIVAVGASAGGIEPFLEILRALPPDPAIAFLFVLHQEKKHQSRLVEVVSRVTNLATVAVVNGAPIEVNHIYVVPAGVELTVAGGVLLLTESASQRGLPIDSAFRSLAADQGDRAVGVILSGSASDGALGTKAIYAEGGITFAQDMSASFAQMPQAAIATGGIDFVLPPAGIAKELVRIASRSGKDTTRLPERELGIIFRLLQAAHDVDFKQYKPSTVERRIRRRMTLHKTSTLPEYVAVLHRDPREIELLYREMLIHVTGFFRDPAVFDFLQRHAFPDLMKNRDHGNPLRVWIPGCATGEEVYSLAILALEMSGELGFTCPAQIFGTDISEDAVDRARLGVYPESISAEVSPERLRRFFTKVDGGYRVAKAVRDCCIFARQNVTKDPPFSRLDMVSCRNVMIYLGNILQRKAMAIFHYALRTNGYLLLGSSETIGTFGNLFNVVDRKHKVYQKRGLSVRTAVEFEPALPRPHPERKNMEDETRDAGNAFREADRVMLTRFAPPAVLINEQMEILQFRGRTSMFLEPPSGVASFNLLKMAREGLLAELRVAIQAARRKEAPVRREGVRVRTNGDMTTVNIEVIPFITPAKERFQLVLFEAVPEETPARGRRKSAVEPEPESRGVLRLKRELEATREYLQSIIEEQEAMNEELRSANEEIQSSNEELQSTNEELETAKEELQSSNEELTTLNEELENRNQDLAEANSDLLNLLGSIDLPIVMLDSDLRIRRFNAGAQRVLNLIPTDAGRPIRDLSLTVVIEDFEQMIISVIEDLEVREIQVEDQRGQPWLLRIRPYKTTDNKIEGAVMVLIDLKKPVRRRRS